MKKINHTKNWAQVFSDSLDEKFLKASLISTTDLINTIIPILVQCEKQRYPNENYSKLLKNKLIKRMNADSR